MLSVTAVAGAAAAAAPGGVGGAVIAASAPDDGGVFSFTAQGEVFAAGDAVLHGSMYGRHLNRPIVGGSASSANGYWMVASDGGIFSFGSAAFYGSEGGHHLNQAIVGMAATPDGRGYWMVASDGGIFSFGDAGFYGSTGSEHLNQPIVGMAATPSGHGYYLVAEDGGIFTFGDARFNGSIGSLGVHDVVGMALDYTNNGYTIEEANGLSHSLGDAQYGQAPTLVRSGAAAIVPQTDGHYLVITPAGGIYNDDATPWQATFGSAADYAYYFSQPVGWACATPVTVYYNGAGASEPVDLAADLAKLSAAYGQRFVATSNPAADITVAWGKVAPGKAGTVAWTYESWNGSNLTHLQIGLLEASAGGLDTPIDATTALLHELGHQGLTDVAANGEEEGAQLTNLQARAGRFGAGDLAGLAHDHAACAK